MVPVGEALQRLESDGLVESRPRSGTVVDAFREDVRGHYVVREALETQAARLFAEKATAAAELWMAAVLDEAYADPCRASTTPSSMHWLSPSHCRVCGLPGAAGGHREEPRADSQLAVQRRGRLP